jgi:predicted metal-dependent HD superfamily phosphohydrolase
MNLQKNFNELTSNYTANKEFSATLWKEIEQNYSSSKRVYHNLTHLEKVLFELQKVKHLIKDWNCLLFAVFYHDIIYNVLKNNNEEKSALLAKERLEQLNISKDTIDLCIAHIEATKTHSIQIHNDTNLFTDADLSILGQESDVYEQYCLDIRKEYSIYPDIVYKPGRKKVIEHFLQMQKIYKTEVFSQKFEMQARINLAKELAALNA